MPLEYILDCRYVSYYKSFANSENKIVSYRLGQMHHRVLASHCVLCEGCNFCIDFTFQPKIADWLYRMPVDPRVAIFAPSVAISAHHWIGESLAKFD